MKRTGRGRLALGGTVPVTTRNPGSPEPDFPGLTVQFVTTPPCPFPIQRASRITGVKRTRLAGYGAWRYLKRNASVRELAQDWGRSYGFVHRLLKEVGVQFKSRGGAMRTKRKQ